MNRTIIEEGEFYYSAEVIKFQIKQTFLLFKTSKQA